MTSGSTSSIMASIVDTASAIPDRSAASKALAGVVSNHIESV